ncbi:hypothetical protein [Lentilactobacillus sunkii]|uniref:D-alanyl-D-alanine carboxypeptidase n=1 Tax=Lentilactobacillus sunkii DSM 19904 TaxID=1423808 RepID=A0A0R1KZF5_9LACO|nr:hypothetical protein [Lentilactobacillus sunkii]KRK86851.1 D-alanyl-D-alanine carboxypeptidase [Lentilactobacillus sunkii DSM 19904]
MKKSILLLITALTTLGFLGTTTQAKPAQASARYHWVKSVNRDNLPYHATSHQSAYIYNPTHTRKLHNLKNYPNTTWYVSKSILMRSSYTSKKGVYYYVTNGAKTISGILWRGYLTAGVNSKTPATTNPTGNGTSNTAILKQQFKEFLAMPQQTAEDQVMQKVKQDLAGTYTFDTNLMNYAAYNQHYGQNNPTISDPNWTSIRSKFGLATGSYAESYGIPEDYNSSWFEAVKYNPNISGNSYINALAIPIEQGIKSLVASHPEYPKVGFGLNIGQAYTYSRSISNLVIVSK